MIVDDGYRFFCGVYVVVLIMLPEDIRSRTSSLATGMGAGEFAASTGLPSPFFDVYTWYCEHDVRGLRYWGENVEYFGNSPTRWLEMLRKRAPTSSLGKPVARRALLPNLSWECFKIFVEEQTEQWYEVVLCSCFLLLC